MRTVQGRIFWLILIVGFAGVGILALSQGDDAGDSGVETVKFQQISEAVDRTTRLLGSRATISASAEIPDIDAEMQMSGTAVFNPETNRGETRITGGVPGHPETSITMTMVTENERFYMYSPQFAGGLPGGKTWMLMRMPAVGDQTNMDPRAQLQYLEQVSGDLEVLGDERVNGVLATHYSGTMDGDRVAAMLREQGEEEAADQTEAVYDANTSEPEFSIWVDQRDLIRRMTMEIPFDLVGGEGATMSMTMDYSDFGIEPQVTIPPESAVFDATELSEQYLEQLTG